MTTVKWLVDELNREMGLISFVPSADESYKQVILSIIDQAEEMEKQQTLDFARHCLDKAKDLDILTSFMNVEQYYNETFKSE